MRFDGKVAVITGSGRGIGKVLAQNFADRGARVTVCDLIEENCLKTVAEINSSGGKAIGVAADITTFDGAKSVVEKAVEAFGTVDILVNNAGVMKDSSLRDMTEEDWDTVINACLKSTFLCSKFASQYMVQQKYGKIVNISSRAYLGNPGQANYSSAKAGIIGQTRALAKELGRYLINVNAVAPGLIETDGLRSHPKYEQLKIRQERENPIQRIGIPQDVANAVMFLASDYASYITGDVLHVSGGRFG
ncbi:SDR family NAD(P)-dependent oxidoreductase [Desulfosporosinus sp.]|uniref:SDR family NAD(P)-dependent oxidoreductase n=1 Tax=Desulfosporosinus sp. TaxID=157907 RepID=UPI0026029D34|nr:SDR family NAD(P)-dependent oxidoreductase [Desulfosporosinus sp.]